MINKLFFFIAAVSFFASAQTIVPIDSLHLNDSSGVAIKTGQVVTINGIVTATNQFGASGPGAVQDPTGGVWIYGNTFSTPAQIGDSVLVTAQLTNYNGLAELDMTKPGSSFVKKSSGHSVAPRVITISQINNQSWNGFEEYEGMLIRINNVSISGTGNFVSNTNYNISDSTGSIVKGLRIAGASNTIVGSPIPSGKIDIIGVLGQYKVGAPYNSGYQLQPRFIQDLVSDSTPLILNPVIASDITQNSFTVYFNTARKGDSRVRFGLSAAALNDSVVVAEDTTYHKVKITGLNPGVEYFYQAISKNSSGFSYSPVQTVITASNDTATGKINVYFNYSVDTSVAIPGNKANGNADFKARLKNRINSASTSIDMAVYSFDGVSDIADAIILAKNRGVKVRIVYDSRTTQASMQLLLNAGIQVSKRNLTSGIMHNKFFVFDGRDSIKTNDWIWTGSFNITSTELTWKNNVLEINDYALAKTYQTEFEEMWGSNNDVPNPSNAKFGPNKSDNTIHNFTIKGRDVKLYFSPSDATSSKMITAINSASKSVYINLFAFTYNDLGFAIRNRYLAGANDVKGIMDDVTGQGNEFAFLQGFGADMKANQGSNSHHKYGVVDASFPDSNPIVITGSHNWSAAAETTNDENTLIIDDIYIANQYMQEFKKRYNELGGTGTFIIPTVGVEDDWNVNKFSSRLFQNYPNPFNPVTTIRFEVPNAMHVTLKVYDMLGREVKTLFNNTAPAGIVAVDFNASGLASGMYVYKIKAGEYTESRKLILMK